MRRLDLPGWAGVTCLLIGSSLALDDRFVQAASPDLEDLLDGKPQLRLYSNLYNTDDAEKPGKFSRESVEAAPDALKLPTFSKHASLPYLRYRGVIYLKFLQCCITFGSAILLKQGKFIDR